MCVRLDPPLRDPSSSYSSHTPSLSPLPLPPASSPPLIQPLTQSEFYQATWDVINSPSTSVAKWGPIEDWDTSGVPSFENAFSTYRNEAGYRGGYGNKAATFNGDISKWITSSVKNLRYTFREAAAFNSDISAWITSSVTDMSSTFRDASSFTGTGVDLWNINKVKSMTSIFYGVNALTSCNKRKIADAWKSNAAFTATTYDTDWAADKCPVPCVTGTNFSTSGSAPCATCVPSINCTHGVKTACNTTTDTACNVPCVAGTSFSTSGIAPCATCAAASSCGGLSAPFTGVKTACTMTTDTVCKVSTVFIVVGV